MENRAGFGPREIVDSQFVRIKVDRRRGDFGAAFGNGGSRIFQRRRATGGGQPFVQRGQQFENHPAEVRLHQSFGPDRCRGRCHFATVHRVEEDVFDFGRPTLFVEAGGGIAQHTGGDFGVDRQRTQPLLRQWQVALLRRDLRSPQPDERAIGVVLQARKRLGGGGGVADFELFRDEVQPGDIERRVEVERLLEIVFRAAAVAERPLRFAAVAVRHGVFRRQFHHAIGGVQAFAEPLLDVVPLRQIPPAPEVFGVDGDDLFHDDDGLRQVPALRLHPCRTTPQGDR